MGKKDKKKEQADPALGSDAPATEKPAAGEGGDGEIVGGPRNPQQIAAQKRLQQTQAQVDEVVDIMRTNVEKVLERDQKLSELDDRADALQQGASQFEQQAGKLKRKFWLQNLKMMIIMGVIGLVIVAIIAKSWIWPPLSPTNNNNVIPNSQIGSYPDGLKLNSTIVNINKTEIGQKSTDHGVDNLSSNSVIGISVPQDQLEKGSIEKDRVNPSY